MVSLEELPDSTADIAMSILMRDVDARRASDWAVDLMALGHLDEATVDLAGLDKTDWQQVRPLLARVAAVIGLDLDDRDMLFAWVERHLLKNYLSGLLSEADLIDCGFAIWSRLVAVEDPDNPFRIYNDLGDMVAMRTGGRGIEDLSTPDVGAWVIEHLEADGAFDRTGLTRPI